MSRTSRLLRRAASLALLSLVAASSSCSWFQNPSTPDEAYVFVEAWARTTIEVIEGKYGLFIDFPMYWYDVDEQTLTVAAPDPMLLHDRSFLALQGDAHSLEVAGGDGGGVASRISAIYELNAQPQDGDLVLMRIEPDGTIQATFRGVLVHLQPGGSWSTTTGPTVESSPDLLLRRTVTYTLTNRGLWPKAKISLPQPSPDS